MLQTTNFLKYVVDDLRIKVKFVVNLVLKFVPYLV